MPLPCGLGLANVIPLPAAGTGPAGPAEVPPPELDEPEGPPIIRTLGVARTDDSLAGVEVGPPDAAAALSAAARAVSASLELREKQWYQCKECIKHMFCSSKIQALNATKSGTRTACAPLPFSC